MTEWTITATQSEEAWLEDYIRDVVSHDPAPLPPHDIRVGHVEAHWHQVQPGVVHVAANGGTLEDQVLVERYLMAQLRPHGYKRATLHYSWPNPPGYQYPSELPFPPGGPEDSDLDQRRYQQLNDKARRLVQSGAVKLITNGVDGTVAQVDGDHGQYQVEIKRDDPNNASHTLSTCTCPWGQFQNTPRSRQWKRFQGRECLKGDALISMADGTYRPIDEVNIGEYVWTHDGVGQVTDIMQRPYHGDLISLYAFGASTPLTLTPEHEVWAYGTPQRLRKPWQETNGQSFNFYDESFLFDTEPEWIAPKDLKLHDWLTSVIPDYTFGGPIDLLSLVPKDWEYEEVDGNIYRSYTRGGHKRRYQGCLPRYIIPSEPLLRVLGLYMAEGNITYVRGAPSQIQWSFGLHEKETLGKSLIEGLRALGLSEYVSVYERPKVNGLSIRITHHPLALLMDALSGKYATKKQWHPWVMALSPTDQAILLKWHREGDGHEGQTDRRWHIDTSSLALALQTRDLLLRNGKLPSVRKQEQKGGPTNRDKSCCIYRISWIENRLCQTNGQRTDPNRTFVSSKIHTIGRVYHNGPVYNLTVFPQQSYVADGRVVHNCAHIMATKWVAAGTPTDESRAPGDFGQQGQMSFPGLNAPLQTPRTMPTMQNRNLEQLMAQPSTPWAQMPPPPGPAPGAPGGMPHPMQTPPTPGVAPTPEGALPQFPMDPALQPQHNPISTPGGKEVTPLNPVQYPQGPGGTFSSWKPVRMAHMSAQTYQNGDVVELQNDDFGTLVGRSEEHGAGQQTPIAKGQVGEVLGTHPSTGMVNVLFMGKPWNNNGQMQPYGATGWFFPSDVKGRPDLPASGYNVRRAR